MKREKVLPAALCGCLLALCVSVGLAVHFWQESREAEAQLAAALVQVERMETQLFQTRVQLDRAEEEKAVAEKERDHAQLQYEQTAERNNPIDWYRYGNRGIAITTAEMSINNAFFGEAWKRELDHVLAVIIEEMELSEEESQCLDRYRQSAEVAGESLVGLIGLMYSNGHIGSIAVPNAEQAIASTYKQYTMELLNTYYFAFGYERYYHFAFDDAFVTEWREKSGGGITASGEQLFPPLSQVLPDQS